MLQVKIVGLKKLMDKAGPGLVAHPLERFFKRAAIAVQNRAREKAPVDTGRLRSSIGYEIDEHEPPRWAKVGTNVSYAPYMEFGTGLFAEGPGAKGGRHWPPGEALGVWAARHGFESGFAVAKAIGMRGGLKPGRFLRDAIKESLGDIRGFLDQLRSEIRGEWKK